ncbi:hypothetical protein ACFLTU_07190 [Bacteroidota bacterium]
MLPLFIISILVFILNVPFGYWRSNVKAFSLQWFLAIHIPVPFIVALRIFSGIGFSWYTFVFLVSAFFLGQKTGSFLTRKINRACHHVSSCLVMDLIRCVRA